MVSRVILHSMAICETREERATDELSIFPNAFADNTDDLLEAGMEDFEEVMSLSHERAQSLESRGLGNNSVAAFSQIEVSSQVSEGSSRNTVHYSSI